LEDVADKFHLRNTLTTNARWLAPVGWKKNKSGRSKADGLTDDELSFLLTDHTGEFGEDILRKCDVFINASGFLQSLAVANHTRREDYGGVLVHSADIRAIIRLAEKRVAVIAT